MDDLFGSPAEALPTPEPEPTPEPAPEPTNDFDDLFGAPTDPEPTPASEPKSDFDDLFGNAADPEMDAVPEPEMTPEPSDDFDGLFGAAEDGGGVPEPEMAPEPSDDFDGLFGAAEDGGGVPEPEMTPEPSDDFDGLFGAAEDGDGVPEPEMTPEPSDDFDGLFGAAGDGDGVPEPEMAPEPSDDFDGLFGNAGESGGDEGEAGAFGGNEPMNDAPAGGADEAPFGQGSADTDGSDAFGDLFGTPDQAEPIDPPSDKDGTGFDIFGAPEENAVPDSAPEPEDPKSLEDLFGDPEEKMEKPSEEDAFDDLFSSRESAETGRDTGAAIQVVRRPIEATVDPLGDAPMRTWIDNTGSFRTTGRVIEIGADFIRLLKSNDRTCTVPSHRLSKADAAYIESLRAAIDQARLALLSAN